MRGNSFFDSSPSGRLFLLLVTIGAVFFCASASVSAEADQSTIAVNWLSMDPRGDQELSRFEQFVFDYVDLHQIFLLKRRKIDLASLGSQLSLLNQEGSDTPTFIYCTMDDYERMLKDPKTKTLLSNLHLELFNSRLISFPFYMMSRANSSTLSSTPKQGPLEVAFIQLPSNATHPVEQADILALLSEIFGRPKNSIRVYRERGAYNAAKKLFDGTYQMIGIYEDEPSMLLNEFNINFAEELKGERPLFVDLNRSKVRYQLNEVAPNRLKYVFFNYIGTPFPDLETLAPASTVIALTQETTHQFPLLLSNLKFTHKVAQDEFSKALSCAYFLILPEVSGANSKDDAERYRIQHSYLLNAYLSDSSNRFMGLGFLGYLLLMKDKKSGDPQEEEIYEVKSELLLKRLGLDVSSGRSIFQWLGVELPEINKRELFTSDVSKLYEDALAKIDQGLKSKGKERVLSFEEARRRLTAAMLQGPTPKDVKGSRGLWSTTDYNPYYQLARVTFYLELEKYRISNGFCQ